MHPFDANDIKFLTEINLDHYILTKLCFLLKHRISNLITNYTYFIFRLFWLTIYNYIQYRKSVNTC